MGHTGLLGRGMAVAALLAAGGGGDTPPPPPAPTPARAPAAPARQPLTPMARVLLQGRMRRHADDMAYLTRAVVGLQYPRIEEAVAAIADEPTLARPLGGAADDAVNAALPQRFFTLEAALHREAAALREAARARDDAALGERFGRLAQACVRCHAEILERR